jgi:murein DD-endopeptidase MepM/ murein hydrolase activator NlpD
MHNYPKPPFRNGGRIGNGYSSSHRAKDINPRLDDSGDVLAIESGVVTDYQSGQAPGDDSPNMVIVRGADGALTVYAHVDPGVFTGTSVARGDVIGRVDMSGVSSGLHVHLSRLPAGEGTVADVEDREPTQGVNYTISLNAW